MVGRVLSEEDLKILQNKLEGKCSDVSMWESVNNLIATIRDRDATIVNMLKTHEEWLDDFYKNEGMAIFIKGKLVFGVHPDNLDNNIDVLDKGERKLNWKGMLDNALNPTPDK